MTYGTSHLLLGVWVGGIFRGRVKKKYCCVRGGHYMKNKNIAGGVLSTQQKRWAKNYYQTLKQFSLLVSLTRHFTKFIFLEQLTTMPQPDMQNMLFFFFFFEAVIMIWAIYFICIIFVKNISIYWLILTVNHQRSYFPFLTPSGGSNIWYPSKFCNHLKHSAK